MDGDGFRGDFRVERGDWVHNIYAYWFFDFICLGLCCFIGKIVSKFEQFVYDWNFNDAGLVECYK